MEAESTHFSSAGSHPHWSICQLPAERLVSSRHSGGSEAAMDTRKPLPLRACMLAGPQARRDLHVTLLILHPPMKLSFSFSGTGCLLRKGLNKACAGSGRRWRLKPLTISEPVLYHAATYGQGCGCSHHHTCLKMLIFQRQTHSTSFSIFLIL